MQILRQPAKALKREALKREALNGKLSNGKLSNGKLSTGSSQTGSSQTGSSQTGSSQTGSSQTGSSQTGSSQTTGSGQTGSADGSPSDDSSSPGENLITDLTGGLGIDAVPYPASGTDNGSKETLSNRVVGEPRVEFPDELGKVRHRFRANFLIENFREEPVIVKLSSITWQGIEILEQPASVTIPGNTKKDLKVRITLPDSIDFGKKDFAIELSFDGDPRIYPREGELSFDLSKGGMQSGTRDILTYIIFGIVALILLALLFLLVRWMASVMAGSSLSVRSRSPTPSRRKTGDRAVEMIVEGQNRNIGGRNVHVIASGERMSVGGKSSKIPHIRSFVPKPYSRNLPERRFFHFYSTKTGLF